jgi:o-succinylbenzoate synthase
MPYRLEFRRYCLPFRNALRTAHGWWREREGLILRLENEAGRIGFGEVAPLPWFGTETLAEAEAALVELNGAVDPGRARQIDERYGCVRFALSAALGSETGIPGVERRAVAALLPAGKAACEAADLALEAGYVAFKWKVGVLDDADEWVVLDDLLARLPAHAKLRLDANGAWNARRASRWLARCAERPIEFVEQPCFAAASPGRVRPSWADDALLGLAADFPTPIALDESVAGLPSLRAWLERGWRGVVVVKPALAGDPASVLEILAKYRADAVFSSALETGVGRQAALRMAFAFHGPQSRALGFGAGPLFQDGRFDGMPPVPFLEFDAVNSIKAEEIWNALN